MIFDSKVWIFRENFFPAAYLLFAIIVSVAAYGQSSDSKTGQETTRLSQTSIATPNQAGVIILVEGDAHISHEQSKLRPVKVGDVISEGDRIVTGKDGELHMTMRDTGFIALRQNTRFRVISYQADGGNEDNGIFRLVTDGFRPE